MTITYEKCKKLLESLKEKLNNDSLNNTQIIEIKNTFINKHLGPIYDEVKLASVEQKKELGKIANVFKNDINIIVEEHLKKYFSKQELTSHKVNYDILIKSANLNKANLTPLNIVTNQVIKYFQDLGFQIVQGNEIVEEKYNFDYLNINKDHPSRSLQDSYYIDMTHMLRTHNTAITALKLENNTDKDLRILSYGNVYRNDEDDATHSHQFMQVDIAWANDKLSVLNLKWLIDGLIKYIFNDEIKTRYRLSYFPFTEPSFEVDMTCANCQGKGCSICKQSGWIEVLGCGMLHQNVFKYTSTINKIGLAAGIGIDRLTMLKYGFNDIRDLYNNDFRILKQFKDVQ